MCNLPHYVNTWPSTCHNKPRKLHGFGGAEDTGNRTWDLLHQRADPNQLSYTYAFFQKMQLPSGPLLVPSLVPLLSPNNKHMLNRFCQKLAFRHMFWIHFCHGATFVFVWLPDPHLYSNSLHSLGAPFFTQFGAQPAILQNLC